MSANGLNVLTESEMRRMAPAAFADAPAPFVSNRYQFLRTADLLPVMEDAGWLPVAASQTKPRRRDPLRVQHMLRFAEASALERARGDLNETVPQAIIINSHNRRTRLIMRAGLYRFICTNGMVIGKEYAQVGLIHHSGDLRSETERGLELVRNNMERVAGVIEHWREIPLTEGQQHTFAAEAAALRFGARAGQYTPQQVLEAQRPEDVGDDLWHVFNRVQENLTKTQLHGVSANGRRVRSRAINGIVMDAQFNGELWSTAESWAERAAA